MPDLEWNKRWGGQAKQFKAGEPYFSRHKIYGYQWGDPSTTSANFVPQEFIFPFINNESVVCEIGPGGGRYTQFLLNAKILYLVEYNEEFFEILRRQFEDFKCEKIYIKSPGSSLPGVADHSVDFVFSFDCFVHLDINLIREYLLEIKRVLNSSGIAVIHYADKTKIAAQKQGTNFSDTTPEIFRNILNEYGATIVNEDVDRISHSAIVAFKF